MKYNPAIHHRRSIRLKNYDYSQAGAYFITICTHDRECLFGNVMGASISLSQYGVIVEQVWHQIPDRFPSIALDAAVIMPNHFHGIIVISDELPTVDQKLLNITSQKQAKKPTLGHVVAYFKYQSTKLINSIRDEIFEKLWQRNYYEHIIRDEASLVRLREYILKNPEKWQSDQLHPESTSKW